MPEYVRVANFDADDAALDSLVSAINEESGTPEGVPAKSLLILKSRDGGKVRTVVRFGSEEDLETGTATLDAMTPPAGTNMQRTSVEQWEVVLERQM
jgi:hypothetical protein